MLQCNLISNDKQERERSYARNALEEYVYDLRGKLSSGDELAPFVITGDRDKYGIFILIDNYLKYISYLTD